MGFDTLSTADLLRTIKLNRSLGKDGEIVRQLAADELNRRWNDRSHRQTRGFSGWDRPLPMLDHHLI